MNFQFNTPANDKVGNDLRKSGHSVAGVDGDIELCEDQGESEGEGEPRVDRSGTSFVQVVHGRVARGEVDSGSRDTCMLSQEHQAHTQAGTSDITHGGGNPRSPISHFAKECACNDEVIDTGMEVEGGGAALSHL